MVGTRLCASVGGFSVKRRSFRAPQRIFDTSHCQPAFGTSAYTVARRRSILLLAQSFWQQRALLGEPRRRGRCAAGAASAARPPAIGLLCSCVTGLGSSLLRPRKPSSPAESGVLCSSTVVAPSRGGTPIILALPWRETASDKREPCVSFPNSARQSRAQCGARELCGKISRAKILFFGVEGAWW